MKDSKTITLGVTDLSFHHIAASLVRNVLVDMGFQVERVYAHHEQNFKNLKDGKVDALASAWLPSSHGGYKEDVETAIPLLELGLHYEPYALWGVPDYIPAEEVAEVADLLKPEVIDKMRPIIQSINPGAGISRFSIKMMEEYGLNELGYSFHTGTEEDCFGTFEQAVANKEWLIVPLWKPQFLHHRYQIRELREPKGLLGIVDRAVLLLRDDKKTLFTENELKTLAALRFSNEIIAKLDDEVCRENKSLDDVTQAWLSVSSTSRPRPTPE